MKQISKQSPLNKNIKKLKLKGQAFMACKGLCRNETTMACCLAVLGSQETLAKPLEVTGC